MAEDVDKIIVANRAGMTAKYGAAGVAKIQAALKGLIAADAARGLATRVVDIDDAGQMAAFGGSAIVNADDERGATHAVDAIYAHANPDYLLLLDGPDVIPHIALNAIPGLEDNDRSIDSDLPYACARGFSRQASSYLAVTRVVGRLPMTQGATDAAAFAGLIDRCAVHAPRPAEAYADVFAISADVWRQSTQLSLSEAFGAHAGLHLSPSAAHPAIDGALPRLTHFINCHGGHGDPWFYGQKGAEQPVAMDSAQVAPLVALGTLAAAECCYGAELYDLSPGPIAQPICMSYLLGGALAFMGSTTTSYGPRASNGQADLIARFFLEEVLKGASTGRAMLQARQRFVTTQFMSDPVNLKTLAQFVLYGDPSLHAVPPPPPAADAVEDRATAAASATDRASRRKARRIGLKKRRAGLRRRGDLSRSARRREFRRRRARARDRDGAGVRRHRSRHLRRHGRRAVPGCGESGGPHAAGRVDRRAQGRNCGRRPGVKRPSFGCSSPTYSEKASLP